MYKSLELSKELKRHANKLNELEKEFGGDKMLKIMTDVTLFMNGNVVYPRVGAYNFLLPYPYQQFARVQVRNDQGIIGCYIVDVVVERDGFKSDADYQIFKVNAKKTADSVMEEAVGWINNELLIKRGVFDEPKKEA